MYREPVVIVIVMLLCLPGLIAKEECSKMYTACIESIQNLPGSVNDKNSAFYKAWGECSCTANICEFGEQSSCYKRQGASPAESTKKPDPVSNSSASNFPTSPAVSMQIEASSSELRGEVEYSTDGGKTFKPLTASVKLKPGDLIGTGFDSETILDFGYGTLHMHPLTQIRIDESVSVENIKKSQVYLNIGAVQATLRHNPSIRADFSVATPSASASIRGSAITVLFDPEVREMTVYVTEDKAYIKSLGSEHEVLVGKSVRADAAGKISAPASFSKLQLEEAIAAKSKNDAKPNEPVSPVTPALHGKSDDGSLASKSEFPLGTTLIIVLVVAIFLAGLMGAGFLGVLFLIFRKKSK